MPTRDRTGNTWSVLGSDSSRRLGKVIRSHRTRQASSAQSAHARLVAVVSCLLLTGLCSGAVPSAAAQPYQDRQVVEVLRDFQRQGVRVIFSSALVTPDMRIAEEPHGDNPEDIITAILAPHDLTLSVGPRGILLVVRAASVIGPIAGGRAATNGKSGAIVGTVRDRATRRPVAAATVRVEGTLLSVMTRDDGRFRLAMVPRWRSNAHRPGPGLRTAGVQSLRIPSSYDHGGVRDRANTARWSRHTHRPAARCRASLRHGPTVEDTA